MYQLNESILEKSVIFQEKTSLYTWHLSISCLSLSVTFFQAAFSVFLIEERTATFGINI